ncbi:hypothetical protein COD10_26465 [Bacillus thuringiensis]|uniref:Group-specific protein n=1 Tax=Bacillus cereus VD184 TaxID=1053242 RepID=A0A9W5R614_BACCE|nr:MULTISPECIES: hypothetical protein [Bacillus cereus group]QDF27170.1 hypothetical protein FJR70_30575 [Bacillus tropicus]AXY11266.1 hypothetical protein CUC43_31965 [Bacillus thuringiensis LM1212]EJR93274.1 hypothetical protein IKM_06005 [Bacillus mycoides]EOQ10489.1 hypothetical protein IKC_05727 [Bacillus cereus VD184]PGT39293.1 hypothetical protein COD10_26465 [Bacillus thuringiensis]
MYPKFFDKMAFSKEHKDLLIQLYDKEITRNEYNHALNKLYETKPKVNENKNPNNMLGSVAKFF